MLNTSDNKKWAAILLGLIGIGLVVWYLDTRQPVKTNRTATGTPIEIPILENEDPEVQTGTPTGTPTVAISPATAFGQVLLTLDKNQIVFKGLAVGTMFFEASFPVHFEDKNGVVLASGLAQAEADWMTTSSVPFTARLKVVQPISPPLTGVLILKKDNPSGLPEHDLTVTFPAILENK